jgi:hypothetical protein
MKTISSRNSGGGNCVRAWVVVQDPYERKMVAVIRSRVQGGGEGLVARRHLTQGTVIGRGHPAAVRMGRGSGVRNL